MIYVLDFGSQYSQLIARRARALGTTAELVAHDVALSKLKNAQGIIISGGPASVYERGAPRVSKKIYDLGVPVLGICYGMQLMCHQLGGLVEPIKKKEYGPAYLKINKLKKIKTSVISTKRPKGARGEISLKRNLHSVRSLDSARDDGGLFAGIKSPTRVWMSHGDNVTRLPKGFEHLGNTDNSPDAAIGNSKRQLFGIQFHPEVEHTKEGMRLISNFVFKIAGAKKDWDLGDFITRQVDGIKARVGNSKIICAVSGGVDSTVMAALVGKAVGKNLIPIFVDHGFMRQGEGAEVRNILQKQLGLPLKYVQAQKRFLSKLKGVSGGEKKRKIIGAEFIKVFQNSVKAIKPRPEFLAQGTIHSDAVTSAGTKTGKKTALIKSHHNVGGLPKDLKLKLVEPLRDIFKDEVREVGKKLGLPEDLVWRQPFPGPGLAVRIGGEVTREKLDILRHADAIVREEVEQKDWGKKYYQYFAQLLSQKTVGVKGDERVLSYPIVVKIFISSDVMTYDWARLPDSFLERLSYRLTNEVPNVTRVLYDISTKPPATVEWD